MPTASDAARAEEALWSAIAGHWSPDPGGEAWRDRPPREKDLILFHDPHDDLARRAGEWGHRMADDDLGSVALLAANLCRVEAGAWEERIPDLATRAYEARRFLIGDRIVHWAVPWLDAVGRWYGGHQEAAHADRDLLLDLAEQMRIAPRLPGREGLVAPGEDSYGPITSQGEERWPQSLWSGALVLDAELLSLGETPDLRPTFVRAAGVWSGLAVDRPGSAQLWLDLAARAARTISTL